MPRQDRTSITLIHPYTKGSRVITIASHESLSLSL